MLSISNEILWPVIYLLQNLLWKRDWSFQLFNTSCEGLKGAGSRIISMKFRTEVLPSSSVHFIITEVRSIDPVPHTHIYVHIYMYGFQIKAIGALSSE